MTRDGRDRRVPRARGLGLGRARSRWPATPRRGATSGCAAAAPARAILMDVPPESGLDVAAVPRRDRLAARRAAERAGGAGRRLPPRAWCCSRTSATTSSPRSAPPTRRGSPGSTRAAVDLLADLQRPPPPGADVGWTPPPYDMARPACARRGSWSNGTCRRPPAARSRPTLAAEFEALADGRLRPGRRRPRRRGAARLPRREPDLAAGAARPRPGRAARLPGHAGRPSGLRPGVAARGRPPRHRRRAARGDARALPRAQRRRAARRSRRAARVLAAQRNLKILGPLHPALPARRQAALPRATCRGSGRISAARPRASRRSRALAAFVARHAAAARADGARPDRGGGVTPRAVMIFAAGLGTRMGELTRDRPKPLIEVAGRPLIDHALALARDAGDPRGSWSTPTPTPSSSRAHLARVAPEALVSHEPELLETGGGLKARAAAARARAGLHAERRHGLARAEPADGAGRGLAARARRAALPRAARGGASGTPGPATSSSTPDGALRRRGAAPRRPTSSMPGRRSSTRRRSRPFPTAVFSLNPVWDALIAEGRLAGIVHRGRLGRRRPARRASRWPRRSWPVTRIFAPAEGPRVFALPPGVDFCRRAGRRARRAARGAAARGGGARRDLGQHPPGRSGRWPRAFAGRPGAAAAADPGA